MFFSFFPDGRTILSQYREFCTFLSSVCSSFLGRFDAFQMFSETKSATQFLNAVQKTFSVSNGNDNIKINRLHSRAGSTGTWEDAKGPNDSIQVWIAFCCQICHFDSSIFELVLGAVMHSQGRWPLSPGLMQHVTCRCARITVWDVIRRDQCDVQMQFVRWTMSLEASNCV